MNPDTHSTKNITPDAFQREWEGGYHEGDPLDPMGSSRYTRLGYMSVLHATFLACIKPYVHRDSVVLEIGPGRGAWTKAIVSREPREVWCLDAVAPEQTGFWDYVGKRSNMHYHQVTDYTASMLPNDHFTYFFTYGCFCHVPNEGVEAYLRNIHPKLRSGAHGFMMVGEFDKYNRAIDNMRRYEAQRACEGLRYLPARLVWNLLAAVKKPTNLRHKDKSRPIAAGAVNWFHLGLDDACAMLERCGYRIVDPDMGVNHRDPVIHFLRP